MNQVVEYNYRFQAHFIVALAALHNFIRIHEPWDDEWAAESLCDGVPDL